MKSVLLGLFFILGTFFSVYAFSDSILPTGTSGIENVSIHIGSPSDDNKNVETVARGLGLKILAGAKLFVSGMALIYIVLIGVYMIVFSENEERIKSQKKQIIYVLIGFLFFNIPSIVYTIFFGPTLGASTVDGEIGGDSPINFWDSTSLMGVRGFIPSIIGFFEIFIFGVAVLMFTWGFFRLILSGGDEEVQKKAKGSIIYGVLGLMFLGFVKVWGAVIVKGDFFGEFATVGNKFLGLALYFAAPVVIFFLVLASFYYITSAGDEEKVKKAKSIFTNTLIAALILLGAYSFLLDLVGFTL